MQLFVGVVILLIAIAFYQVDAQTSSKNKEDSKKVTTVLPTTKRNPDVDQHHAHNSNEHDDEHDSDEHEGHSSHSNCSKKGVKLHHDNSKDASNISIDITNIVNGGGGNQNGCGNDPTCPHIPAYSCSSVTTGCVYAAATSNPHVGYKAFCSLETGYTNYWGTYMRAYCHNSSKVPCFLTEVEQRVCFMLCPERQNDCSPLCHQCEWDSTYVSNTYPTTAAALTTNAVTTPAPTTGYYAETTGY